ncbi:hypothetical protein [Pandoraea norimbergensis]|uniref:Acyl-CoA dehydrogenase/oxidase C-terminal domain-containing protein n=1 Tax=Pandoraea norimbergensis TaxID=93219 RepID=A0ABN4JPY1_9BURK|nr:hypothetical protein [Pandoraea norimbergensis]ALS62136.1 hypothetical protein AT302_22450 [Pandoraea norimbergensis]
MLPAHPLSLPLHGYPAQQLSEVRADAIQFGVGALEHALRNEVDNTVASRAAFEQFRRCVMQMGLWDYIKDFFTNGARKRSILDALARCHIGSSVQGREYLRALGEYPLKTGESSLYLLAHLTTDVRSYMLMPTPDNLSCERLILADSGPPIQVIVPGIGLRLPLMADCFGDGYGAVTPTEYNWLMNGEFAGGKSISQILSDRHEALSLVEYETLGLACESDAHIYLRAGLFKIASQLLQSAIEAFVRLTAPEALIRCLGQAQVIFPIAGDASAVVKACDWYASTLAHAGRNHEAKEVRREVDEFERVMSKHGGMSPALD